MSSKNLNKEILLLFPNHKSVITTPKIYIQLTGSHSLAIVLNQCVFWSNKSRDGWFYKSYEEWSEETNISIRTLKRRFDKLEECGLISTKVKQVNGKTFKHFFVYIDKIIDHISVKLDVTPKEKINTQPDKIGRTGNTHLADPTIIYTDDYIQTTFVEQSVSNHPLTQNQTQELIQLRATSDSRPEEEFIENCLHHIQIQKNDMNMFQKFYGIKKILTQLKQSNEIFNAKDFNKKPEQKNKRIHESEKLRIFREKEQERAWLMKKPNNKPIVTSIVENQKRKSLAEMLNDYKKCSQ